MTAQDSNSISANSRGNGPVLHRASVVRFSDAGHAMEMTMPAVDDRCRLHENGEVRTKGYDPKIMRRLNDAFRRTLQGGKVVFTSGVDGLSSDVRERAVSQVRRYNNFTKENDPFGDHSLGRFTVHGQGFQWKIEAFDKDLRYGSPDPCDPDRTTRVLTLMLACEY